MQYIIYKKIVHSNNFFIKKNLVTAWIVKTLKLFILNFCNAQYI